MAQHPPGQPYDSLNQIWAGGPGGLAESNSVLTSISLDNYPVGDGTVSLKIIDLERKVNINTANAATLQQALTLMGVDATTFPSCPIPSRTGLVRRSAARGRREKRLLSGPQPPYNSKNAPMDDLSELLLVKGVTSGNVLGRHRDESRGPSRSSTNSASPTRPASRRIIRSD